jgi:antitoxin component HigA of HigAB toxin-antitoxin module
MALVARFPLGSLRSERDLDRATKIANELAVRGNLSRWEHDYLDVLSDLIEAYEAAHHRISDLSGPEMLRHLLTERGISQASAARVPGSTQSAVARRSAEAELRALIAKFAPDHLRLIGAMRRWLRKRLPTAHEIVYEYRDCFVISFSPNERGYEGVLAIRASPNGVRLYFNQAKELPDPAKLLQGSGKQTRWINVESGSALAHPEVVRLIDEAMARNREPFASAGRGSVVIRSTSAKQRREPRA